jgi:hypothetical protein
MAHCERIIIRGHDTCHIRELLFATLEKLIATESQIPGSR